MNRLKKKRILFITGTRADYGKLKPLIKAVESDKNYECYIFVSGMHLLEQFGSTYREVLKEGYLNVHVASEIRYTNSMSQNVGNTILAVSEHLHRVNPDMVVVHGDRIDALAAAIAGALNNVLVAHVEGGEISGTIDESIRHGISKFAHIHFTCNEEANKRLIQMGENPKCIYMIGSPDIDIMLSNNLPSLETVKKYYNINFETYGILMYHPVTTDKQEVIKNNISNLVDAAVESNKNYIIIYPNNDTGSEIILEEYEKLRDNACFKIYPSLRFEYFLTLLKNAGFVIGNSSAGVRESGVYGIPAIDLGSRQKGRYDIENLKNIQHVQEMKADILKAIGRIEKHRIQSQHFGKGNSTELFIGYLKNESLWNINIQKQFIDLGETL